MWKLVGGPTLEEIGGRKRFKMLSDIKYNMTKRRPPGPRLSDTNPDATPPKGMTPTKVWSGPASPAAAKTMMLGMSVMAEGPANATVTAQAPDKSGDRVGESETGFYQLEKKLGEGGMGAVYKARMKKFIRKGEILVDEWVAIKVVKFDEALGDLEGEARETAKNTLYSRFMDEIKLIYTLTLRTNHPNIVRILDVGEDFGADKDPFCVMEFLEGQDLESVEKKMERLARIAKTGDKDARRGIEVLEQYKAHLEDFQNARTLEVSDTDRKHVEDLFLLTSKPVMYVCNVEDEAALTGNAYVEKVKEYLAREECEVLVLAARLESEIAELEDEGDRKEFLEDAGLEEPGVNKLVRAAYSMLNLVSFFTVGPKEIRAWTIRKGSLAPEAAGVIHSDLQRGFIRAEVMKYEDFISLGSEEACKKQGKLSVEGKKYVVEEADILHILFNV